MSDPAGPDDDQETEDAASPADRVSAPSRHRPTGRFSRFAKLSSMTAQVAARQFRTKVTSAFVSEERASEGRSEALKTSAEQIADTMGHLKGAAMKVGQMLSADPELLPDEFTDALAKLQSEAPPMDLETVRGVVETALETDLEEAFTFFSEEPIGAASIGQVHRATTRDGQDVAVKVQYPGIADTIESDMKNLGALLNLARTKIPKDRVETYRQEITDVIVRESDYLLEADSLERFQVVLRDVEGVRVPIPVHELTRKQVLTMEYIEGQRLHDWMAAADDEGKRRQGERVIRAYIEMIHNHGALHADPHPGNFLVDASGNVVFLDLGCVRDYSDEFATGLLDVMIALWRSDSDALMQALDDLGHRREGVDDELIHEWLEMVLEPLLVDKEWDYGTWPIHERSLRFVRDNPSILSFAPPREAIFYLRVLGGLRGLMGQAGVRVNSHRIAKDAVRSMGLI